MAIRNILVEGDEMLNKKCRAVTDFNNHLHTLIDDMRETLLASGGAGLAAPQIGVLRRVVSCWTSTKILKRWSSWSTPR